MSINEIVRKCGVVLGWIAFLGVLVLALRHTANPANAAGGPVTTVCIHTKNDADSILLVQDGAAILIDAGEETDAPHILEVLQQYGVEELDYFILTHGDKDHAGGAARILSQVPARRVIQPYYEAGEQVQSLNAMLDEMGIPVIYPARTLRLQAGEMRFLVYPPLEGHYTDDNNYSLAVLVEHGQVKQLFTGDALRKRSEELLLIDWPEVDLYKVPHHGRANSATGALFDALRPRYAVVTAQSADEAVLQAAQRNHTQLFYTADGDCTFVSDGSTLQSVP